MLERKAYNQWCEMSIETEQSSPHPEDQTGFDSVPNDFPKSVRLGALPGLQPKVLATKYMERFYPIGSSPPEIYERWEICEDLARQLAEKSLQYVNGIT